MRLQPGHIHRTWEGTVGQEADLEPLPILVQKLLVHSRGGSRRRNLPVRALPAAPGQCLQD